MRELCEIFDNDYFAKAVAAKVLVAQERYSLKDETLYAEVHVSIDADCDDCGISLVNGRERDGNWVNYLCYCLCNAALARCYETCNEDEWNDLIENSVVYKSAKVSESRI